MSAPTLVAVTESQIDLSWAALTSPQNGNSDITEYILYWDNGGGTPNILLLEALQTTLSVTGLTGGTTYRFKVKARNIYGDGAFSSELAVLASDKPDKVDIPNVSIGAAETSVSVSWNLPDAHSSAITAYQVQLLKSDGTYSDSSDCNGTLTTVINARGCAIPMQNIVTLTSLSVDTLIKVRVRA